jgi:nucleosome binding factor SPN SPT16 subunit
MGLDFRDGMLTLSSKNPTTFKAGMTFSLISAFQNLSLSQKDRENTPKESSVSYDLGYDCCDASVI